MELLNILYNNIFHYIFKLFCFDDNKNEFEKSYYKYKKFLDDTRKENPKNNIDIIINTKNNEFKLNDDNDIIWNPDIEFENNKTYMRDTGFIISKIDKPHIICLDNPIKILYKDDEKIGIAYINSNEIFYSDKLNKLIFYITISFDKNIKSSKITSIEPIKLNSFKLCIKKNPQKLILKNINDDNKIIEYETKGKDLILKNYKIKNILVDFFTKNKEYEVSNDVNLIITNTYESIYKYNLAKHIPYFMNKTNYYTFNDLKLSSIDYNICIYNTIENCKITFIEEDNIDIDNNISTKNKNILVGFFKFFNSNDYEDYKNIIKLYRNKKINKNKKEKKIYTKEQIDEIINNLKEYILNIEKNNNIININNDEKVNKDNINEDKNDNNKNKEEKNNNNINDDNKKRTLNDKDENINKKQRLN